MTKFIDQKTIKIAVVIIGILVVIFGSIFLYFASRRQNSAINKNAPITPSSENMESGETEKSFTFTAAGDFKNTESAKKVLESIGSSSADFTLALGDLGYLDNGRTEQQWCDFVKESVGNDRPFQIVAGNHDDGRDGDITNYVKCLPNKIQGTVGDYGLNYYFDYNDTARFIMISPDIDNYGKPFNEGSAELLWLEGAIGSGKKDGKWIILGMHKNCITPGVKPCEIGEEVFNKSIKLGVDLILQGHEHAYFRSKQLKIDGKDGCPGIIPNEFNQKCVSANGGSYQAGDGSILVISGAGGMPLREYNTQDPEAGYFESFNAKSVNEAHGYNIFKVSEHEIKARFVSVTGNFTDEFSISR